MRKEKEHKAIARTKYGNAHNSNLLLMYSKFNILYSRRKNHCLRLPQQDGIGDDDGDVYDHRTVYSARCLTIKIDI